MATGYALISTAPNKEKNVLTKLRDLDVIQEAHLLVGEYDIITKIESDSIHNMGKVIVDDIRHIDGVIHTKTLCTFNINF